MAKGWQNWGLLTGAGLITHERSRQINEEDYKPEHDEIYHDDGQLVNAAMCYLLPSDRSLVPPDLWPWDSIFWKPSPDDRIAQLIKAGALVAAEIDRLLKIERKKS